MAYPAYLEIADLPSTIEDRGLVDSDSDGRAKGHGGRVDAGASRQDRRVAGVKVPYNTGHRVLDIRSLHNPCFSFISQTHTALLPIFQADKQNGRLASGAMENGD